MPTDLWFSLRLLGSGYLSWHRIQRNHIATLGQWSEYVSAPARYPCRFVPLHRGSQCRFSTHVATGQHAKLFVRGTWAYKCIKLRSEEARLRSVRLRCYLHELIALHSLPHPNLMQAVQSQVIMTHGSITALTHCMARARCTLAQLLSQQNELTPRALHRYVENITQGLAYMHHCHLVHGDLKPDNVLIMPQGHAVLADFSLTKREQWGIQNPLGTQGWQSPETQQGQPYDQCSEVYVFGLVCAAAVCATAGVRAYVAWVREIQTWVASRVTEIKVTADQAAVAQSTECQAAVAQSAVESHTTEDQSAVGQATELKVEERSPSPVSPDPAPPTTPESTTAEYPTRWWGMDVNLPPCAQIGDSGVVGCAVFTASEAAMWCTLIASCVSPLRTQRCTMSELLQHPIWCATVADAAVTEPRSYTNIVSPHPTQTPHRTQAPHQTPQTPAPATALWPATHPTYPTHTASQTSQTSLPVFVFDTEHGTQPLLCLEVAPPPTPLIPPTQIAPCTTTTRSETTTPCTTTPCSDLPAPSLWIHREERLMYEQWSKAVYQSYMGTVQDATDEFLGHMALLSRQVVQLLSRQGVTFRVSEVLDMVGVVACYLWRRYEPDDSEAAVYLEASLYHTLHLLQFRLWPHPPF